MKAVKITTSNVDMLATRFTVTTLDKEEVLPIGYYLVTDFGNDETFEVLTEEYFHTIFNVTEETLLNDFVDIVRK